jgi:hypothetical protein
MKRNRRRRSSPHHCQRCRLQRLPEERFPGGLCLACLEVVRRRKRRALGANVLAKATHVGTLERDGQTFQLVVLPPKRRRSRH